MSSSILTPSLQSAYRGLSCPFRSKAGAGFGNIAHRMKRATDHAADRIAHRPKPVERRVDAVAESAQNATVVVHMRALNDIAVKVFDLKISGLLVVIAQRREGKITKHHPHAGFSD